MAWYGHGGWEFRPYVSVAEKKARAARALAGIVKKGGRAPEPVVIAGRKIVSTFWGKAWCDNLEHYMDFVNRLPRGRTYVRNGSVVDLRLAPGQVYAHVAGRELYSVKIDIAQMTQVRWHRVVARCTGKIGSLASGAPAGRAVERRPSRADPPEGRALPGAERDHESARARTGRRCASTSPLRSTAWARASTISLSCSSRCARWTRPSS